EMVIKRLMVGWAKGNTVPPVIASPLTLSSKMGCLHQGRVTHIANGTLGSVLFNYLEPKTLLAGASQNRTGFARLAVLENKWTIWFGSRTIRRWDVWAKEN